MNISMTQSRINLLHFIAFLLVCTMAFVTVVTPVIASHCADKQQAVDDAESDIDTYRREADEYKEKYDNTSWTNPPKKLYYKYMWNRALERMHDAMQRRDDAQEALDDCEDEHSGSGWDSGGCGSGGCG